MTKIRIGLITLLVIAPVAFLMAAGSYHLWATGWLTTAWWPMALSITAGYALLWLWTRQKSNSLLPETGQAEKPNYWTVRDQEAWNRIDARVAAGNSPSIDDLTNADRYAEEALALALEIAQVYQPGATDPFRHLTLPEILTCAELVSEDLSKRVNDYAIGSHLLTIGQWRNFKQYAELGQKAWNMSWLARIVMNPVKAGAQFAASKAGGGILNKVQGNVLAWFHAAYLHELGRYLIELNSGRLRVGARRYRELMASKEAPPDVTQEKLTLTVCIFGALKAGKSSLINSLLGENLAGVDVIPLTAETKRYELNAGDLSPIVLLDTPGYGAEGPCAKELDETYQAAIDADILVMVTPARSAARKADVDILTKLTTAFTATPSRKMPPVVVALSHVDLLTPAAEWAPPYEWTKGIRPKETTMRDAVLAAKEQLGELPIVPVVTLPDRLFNVKEELLPTIAKLIPDARGAAILRLFHQEGIRGAGAKAVEQVMNLGREALKTVWGRVKPVSGEQGR